MPGKANVITSGLLFLAKPFFNLLILIDGGALAPNLVLFLMNIGISCLFVLIIEASPSKGGGF